MFEQNLIYKNIGSQILKNVLLLYFPFIFLLFLYFLSPFTNNEEFCIQICSIFIFLFFLILGKKYTPQAFMLFITLYQLSLSILWGEYFFRHQYILEINKDWITYVKWASIAGHTNNFHDFFCILKNVVPEISDLGYPIFLYPYYHYFDELYNAYIFSVIGKAIFYLIGTNYVYKLSLRFLDKCNAKVVFLLWGLNPASIFFNGTNLKETVFATICIFAVYNLVVYRDSKNILFFIKFVLFTFITVLFRIYVTLFIIATFFAVTLFKNLINKYFHYIWIVLFISLYYILFYLGQYHPGIRYALHMSVGGGSGLSIFNLIVLAFISPIPALS